MIAALVPPYVVPTHTAPYLLQLKGGPQDEAFLIGVLGSIPFDWYMRRIVENHVTFDVLNGTPMPCRELSVEMYGHVAHIAGRLAAVDDRYAKWANEVEVPVGRYRSERDRIYWPSWMQRSRCCTGSMRPTSG